MNKIMNEKLGKAFDKYKYRISKKITFNQFKHFLETIFRESGIDFIKVLKKDDKIFLIEGLYCEEFDEEEKQKFIHLRIYCEDEIDVSDKLDFIKQEILILVLHELHHAKQARDRCFVIAKSNEHKYEDSWQKYMSEDDEVDAYSHDIKTELYASLLDKNIIIDALRKGDCKKYSDRFDGYQKVFGLDHDVTKKLSKKVYALL